MKWNSRRGSDWRILPYRSYLNRNCSHWLVKYAVIVISYRKTNFSTASRPFRFLLAEKTDLGAAHRKSLLNQSTFVHLLHYVELTPPLPSPRRGTLEWALIVGTCKHDIGMTRVISSSSFSSCSSGLRNVQQNPSSGWEQNLAHR